MGGPTQLQLPFPWPVVLIISMIILVVSILIAFDARDRGMSKFFAIVWAIAVQLFPPAALVYLLVRRFVPRPGMSQGPRPDAPPPPPHGKNLCPYCGADIASGAKLCAKCGRLL